MDNAALQRFVSDIIARGEILESDILLMRSAIGDDLYIDIHEADLLFRLNNLPKKTYGWDEYFIQVITTFLIHQTPPKGYISEINASWLMARIQKDGIVETHTEMALLLNMLKLAKNVTNELEMFALAQVENAVLNGEGYLAQGRAMELGVIGEAEVEMLRTIFYSGGGAGGVGISSPEAVLLFDLNDACQNADNHPSWQNLFVRAIANHLMMVAAYQQPSMEGALRRENWLEDIDSVPNASWRGALKHLGNQLSPGKFAENLKSFNQSEEETYSHMHISDVFEDEKLTENESGWLIERLNRDGVLDANKKALLQFLAEECPDVHDSLLPMIKAA